MDLTGIFRAFDPKATEYAFFLIAYETFSSIHHILDHNSGLNKYKKIEIIPCIFSDHNTMKLEVSHKKKSEKGSNTWRIKNITLKNE